MSIAAPFLVLLILGGVAAYHRWRLAPWVALSAAGLVACALLGASMTATIVAAVIVTVFMVTMPFGWAYFVRHRFGGDSGAQQH